MSLEVGDPDLTSLKFMLFQSIKRKRLAELFKISPALHDVLILHVTAHLQIQHLQTSMYKPRGELNCDMAGSQRRKWWPQWSVQIPALQTGTYSDY